VALFFVRGDIALVLRAGSRITQGHASILGLLLK
jgi:hypothetical protein